MSKLRRWSVALAVLTLLGSAVAQSEVWSGLIFGLPEEAAGIALYFLDVDWFEGTSKEEMLTRVSPGELLDNGTFKLSADTDAALKTDQFLPVKKFFNLIGLVSEVKSLKVTPEDAKFAYPIFGIENRQEELIGALSRRDNSDDIRSTVFASEPILIEGVVDETEFDIAARPGFNDLVLVFVPNFAPTYRTKAKSPQEWVYEALP